MNTKKCSFCDKVKPLAEFHRRNKNKDGRQRICKVCSQKYHKDYFKKNKNKHSRWMINHRKKLRQKAFEIVANGKPIVCAMQKKWKCCCNSDFDFLSFDHINSGGAEHRRELGGQAYFIPWIINNPSEARKRLQILCANAQAKKAKLNDENLKRSNRK